MKDNGSGNSKKEANMDIDKEIEAILYSFAQNINYQSQLKNEYGKNIPAMCSYDFQHKHELTNSSIWYFFHCGTVIWIRDFELQSRGINPIKALIDKEVEKVNMEWKDFIACRCKQRKGE